MLVLTRHEVEELLDLDTLVDALAEAHRALSADRVSMPARGIALAERDGLLGTMPAYVPGTALAVKLVTLFPHNRDRHTHQAAIMVFDHENGTPIALMDGTYITATRTAGRDRGKAEAMAEELGVEAAASFEDASRGADVVAATTHTDEPIVRRE